MSRLKVIHVNQHVIKDNLKHNRREHPITAKIKHCTKTNIYSSRLQLQDAEGNVLAEFIYAPDKPLSCGARVWVESKLRIVDAETGQSIE